MFVSFIYVKLWSENLHYTPCHLYYIFKKKLMSILREKKHPYVIQFQEQGRPLSVKASLLLIKTHFSVSLQARHFFIKSPSFTDGQWRA